MNAPRAHLVLRLEGPLMSFGGDMIDARGVVRDFPARSMVTGLLANALGWERHEAARHARLQARLAMGSLLVRAARRIRDFQTAKLEANDRGWTTRGRVEGRAGGAATYASPHIRHRDADADGLVLVALRLDPAAEAPTLETVADALDRPERPLFLGRKPFLPASPINFRIVAATGVAEALRLAAEAMAAGGAAVEDGRAQWPVGEDPAPDGAGAAPDPARMVELTDERNWITGVHAGLRRAMEGRIGGQAAIRTEAETETETDGTVAP